MSNIHFYMLWKEIILYYEIKFQEKLQWIKGHLKSIL
jgi:hypothetical protein